MTNSRSISVIVVFALIASASGAAVMSAAAAQPDVQISSVNVAPSNPAPGESVTVETTISNLASSNGTVDITDIYLRTSGTTNEHGRIQNVGSVAPGSTVTIPLSTTFENTGNHRLTVHVVVRDADGDHHSYEYPVYVTVEEPDDVQLSLSSSNAVEDAETTVNATIANGNAETISNIRLALDGTGTIDNAERVSASIESGSERTFEYDVTFDESGRQSVSGEVTYTTAGGATRTTTASMPVDVAEPEELPVSFSINDAVVGDDTPVNVTVSNSYPGTLRNVQVNLSGDAATVDNSERIQSSIASEAEQTFAYDVEFSEAGRQDLTAEFTYTTSGDVTRTTTRSVTVDVAEPNVDASLSASTNDSVTTVELSNFGNTELSEVEITATDDDGVISRELVSNISPDASENVTFDIADAVNGSVTFTATYEAAGDTYTAETTEEINEAVLGEIRLTGVEVTQSGSSLLIEGDASNVGSTDAESVLLTVQGSDGGSEYFVGSVEASEFATFELSAQPPGTSSSIPVEISYIVDGERVTTVQQIELSSTNMSASSVGGQASAEGGQPPAGGGQQPPGGSGGLLGGGLLSMLPVAFGVVLIGAIGFGVYRWRQHS